MILKDTLGKIVDFQRKELRKRECGVERELFKLLDMKCPHALIISGIRRCGKSTLLRQITKKLDNFYYFNFDDQRVSGFEVSDFEKLDEVFHELNGESNFYLFDEIQNVSEWERFVRKMQDSKKKFVITGSNASLLSRELGTKLTGRHLINELFPFSYYEMLKLLNKKPSLSSFEVYFKNGGFPEYLRYDNEAILQEVFNDIILRDIVVRYGLRNTKIVKELAIYLLSNAGKEFSYSKLRKLFDLGSTNTVISYISHYEDSYLIFTVPRFSYSYKKQLVNPKKVYAVDVGLTKANSMSFSQDNGRILENLVFLHLKRKYKEVYYFKNKNECDFLVKEKGRITQAIQVCYKLDEDNKEREINGLKEAMNNFQLKKGLIITFNQDDTFKNIQAVSAWKWMELY
ncbi:MAG: ATP-binding protein [Nanoarchaeota archaeon]|nr:ATP-binding protein [Nanoarchaeota archaeon]MBU1269689.1 ATP-binding protein [Nanoarchaeota archaeon]MBU1605129.1 ATP-binding protein [Nanoarchaeota archaeon]MBU2442918.1 ATP-binding protein [Nanoarchaeota archaeon]